MSCGNVYECWQNTQQSLSFVVRDLLNQVLLWKTCRGHYISLSIVLSCHSMLSNIQWYSTITGPEPTKTTVHFSGSFLNSCLRQGLHWYKPMTSGGSMCWNVWPFKTFRIELYWNRMWDHKTTSICNHAMAQVVSHQTLHRLRFKPRLVHVGYMVDNVALGLVLLWVFQLSMSSISPHSFIHPLALYNLSSLQHNSIEHTHPQHSKM